MVSEQTLSAITDDALHRRRVLNLGSGRKKRQDAINVDIVSDTDPDMVVDLNIIPWPLPNGHFDRVLLHDVIEHLDDIVATMEEIHRICRHAAVIEITVPHFSCPNAFTDPTHRHYFGLFSFHYFTDENEFPFYSRSRFRRRSNDLFFVPSLLNKFVWRFANRFPQYYERRWAWIFPAWFLRFELEVLKPERPEDAKADQRT
jgi:SAM-dependent methyltransferase